MRGGKRPGAGRKTIDGTVVRPYRVTLDVDSVTTLRRLGGGALSPGIRAATHDAIVMALRLYGESERTMSPECMDVMERWHSICDAVLADE